jgi:hypothetical protein
MTFRHSNPSQDKTENGTGLEELLVKLPKATPRPGLKEEMLSRILVEASQAETVGVRYKRAFHMPTLRYSMSVAGLVMTVALVLYSLPNPNPEKVEQWTTVAGLPASPQVAVEKEISLRKAERETLLLQQAVPRNDGNYIGEGVEIILNDTKATLVRKGTLSGDVEASFDLYSVVQEIYENGGNVVSINGILVEPYTEIVTKGALTAIHDRRINAPFTIKVIGDSERLFAKLSDATSVLSTLERTKELEVDVQRNHLVTIAMN